MTFHPVTAPLPAAGTGLLGRLLRRWQLRQTAVCLSHLDDRMLADIGFARRPEIERFRLVA